MIARSPRLRCVHFTGIQNNTCKAGVAYADVKDTTERPYRWACMSPDVPCASRRVATQEEAEAEDRALNALFANVDKARQAIVVATDDNRDVSGEMACPVCDGGTLRYSVARNGHIHAACSTSTCVRWME